MAKLTNQVIGRLSGKVGNIVFRQRNGKNFASSRPSSFYPGFDEASISRRDRFGMACKFSSRVYAQPYLKKIWKNYLPSGKVPYNYITKINYKYAEPGNLTDLAVIVPDSGFDISINSSSLSPPGMQVITSKIGINSGINPSKELFFRLCTIICLTNPRKEYMNHVEFITLTSEKEAVILDSQITFELCFSSKEMGLFNAYNNKKAFSAIITLDADENPVHYSKTFTG
jgi:hypothetical protein